jgi:hypothetical protein
MAQHDLIFVGMPATQTIHIETPATLSLRPSSFSLDGQTYDRPEDCFFGVFPHPLSDDRVAAVFWLLPGADPERTARKITHYGKYSYLAFTSARNTAKGIWPATASPLTYQWRGHN